MCCANAIQALPQLVEQLETGSTPSADLRAIMGRAEAYAEGREPEQHATTTTTGEDLIGGGDSLVESASTQVAVPTREKEAPRPTTPARPAMDPVLHDIYSRESAEHLATIRDFLARTESLPPPWTVSESLYRACHTLSGSSKMAEARQGIKIAEPLNHYMRKLHESGVGLDPDGREVLRLAADAIENVVANINESTGFFAAQPVLVERIRELDTALDAVLAARPLDIEASAIIRAPLVEEPPAPAELETDDSDSDSDSGEFDADIAAIFSEEATELLEAADHALSGLSADRTNNDLMVELKRHLHTLKGGARMAGISAMGSLSHELETLVLHIESGAVAADDRAYDLLQASLDELGHMRDAVGAGRRVEAARELIQRIHALSGAATPASTPAPASAAAAAVEPAVPAPPPAPEPQAVRPAPVAPVEAPTTVPARSPEPPRVERPIPAPTPEAAHFAMSPESRSVPASLAPAGITRRGG